MARPAPAYGSPRWVAWRLARDARLHRGEADSLRAYPVYCPVTGIRYSRAEREFHVMCDAGLICQDCTDDAVATLVHSRAPVCEQSLRVYLGGSR